MLQAKLFERAEQLSGRKSGRYTEGWDPEEMSILTGVMGITKEVSLSARCKTLLSLIPCRPRNTVGVFKDYMRKEDFNVCWLYRRMRHLRVMLRIIVHQLLLG